MTIKLYRLHQQKHTENMIGCESEARTELRVRKPNISTLNFKHRLITFLIFIAIVV